MLARGTFRYSPTLNGSLQRRDGGTTQWWLIIDVDAELGRYLRYQYMTATYRTRTIHAPLWGTHISVIRGEQPPREDLWGQWDGQDVEFQFGPDMFETKEYLWLPVVCEPALRIREDLGLPREPTPSLHLTIGNSRTG